MQPPVPAKVIALLKRQIVCRLLRLLLLNPKGIAVPELAKQLRQPSEKIDQVLCSLEDVGLAIRARPSKKWKFCFETELEPHVEKAIAEYERAFVKRRAERVDYHAAEKLRAIDELAEIISIARADYRS